jgi:DNA-binding Xre family transcriptional regulator
MEINWNKYRIKIKKVMIEKNIGNAQLGKAIGLSENHVSSVITGYILSEPARKKICDYLGIKY